MTRLMFAVGAALVGMSFNLQPANAYTAPWCAVISLGTGSVYWDCQYSSFEQCLPNVLAGNRGFCNHNPYYSNAYQLAERRRYRKTLALARTKDVAVTMRFAMPVAAMLLLCGFTQAELEKAKSTTDFYKDAYWKCLADEILRAVPTSMSAQEFSVLTKSACPKERGYFFNSLSNYIVMLQPDVDRSTVAPAANIAVLEAQKDAVQALNDLRSGKRQMPAQPR